MDALIGRKLGMTQTFLSDGRVEAVSVLEAGPCWVTQTRTAERDGYTAVQLGFGQVRRLNRPERGHLRTVGVDLRHLREFRVDDVSAFQVGQKVGAEIFAPGDYVDVVGISRGRGFQGGVKRHGFRGGPKTHGQSDRHRAPGSIGATTTPGKVMKGLRMAGHMGARRVTVRNLQVVESNPDRGVLLVRGGVPGAPNTLVLIRRASKKGR